MRPRFSIRPALAAAAGLACLASAGSAIADDEPGWREGRWHGGSAEHRRDGPQRYEDSPPPYDAHAEEAPLRDPGREAWLADCRQRVSSQDRGLGGAVIGGVVGGVAGNRIAGRGNRTVGTLAGAAVGAAAGAVIDKAEDRGRNRDVCEAYLDDYYARYRTPTYGAAYDYAPRPGPGYAYPQAYAPAYGCCGPAPMMMVPAPTRAEPDCVETIEYIYEDVPVRRKAYRTPVKRTKIVRDKRVRISAK